MLDRSLQSEERAEGIGRRRVGVMLGRVFGWLRPRAEAELPMPVVRHFKLTNPWHAVSIAANKRCCQASGALKRRRFLSGEAPRLPLAACSQAAHCVCVYKHFNDRRAGFRRATEQDPAERRFARPATAPLSQERRHTGGRRATDGIEANRQGLR